MALLVFSQELRLDNSTLLASANFSDWDVIAPLPSYGRGRDFPGPRYTSLLHGYNLTDVRITSNYSNSDGGVTGGGGCIDGQGEVWWQAVVNGSLNITPGHLVEFLWSSNIEIDHVTLVDSPFWNLHIWSSNFAHIHNVAVRAPLHSTNTDGIDPDSASDVLIEDVDIANGDDCIAIKSGWNQFGVEYGVPTQRVEVRRMRCSTQSACIAIGSEMSGGISDCIAHEITCDQAGQGFNVKSALGRGGYIRNVTFADSVFSGVGPIGCAFATVDNYKDQYPPAPVDPTLIPIVDGVIIRNISAAKGSGFIGTAGDFQGLGNVPSAGQITGVNITDVNLGSTQKGWTCVNVTGASSNVAPAPCKQLQ